MKRYKKQRLVVFFSHGISLEKWEKSGGFEREVAIYRRLQQKGVKITFVTYGTKKDLSFRSRLPGVRILCNRWGLSIGRYARYAPFLHAPFLMRANIYKTNQTNGGDLALRAARLYGKKLIARGGYLLSDHQINEHGKESIQAQNALDLEYRLFSAADRVVVTTSLMKRSISYHHGIENQKIQVIPNYVETDKLRPLDNIEERKGVCFIGKLEDQKNTFALLDAMKGLSVELTIIGDGKLRKRLERKANDEAIPVRFLGRQTHDSLPVLLNRALVFILPSHYEGHPKALIEAMSCGLPVIGTDVIGTREVLKHRESGFVCGTGAEELHQALVEVLADAELREHMGRCARNYVVRNLSLDETVEKELDILDSLVPTDF